MGWAAGAVAVIGGRFGRRALAAPSPLWIGTRLAADGKSFATAFDAAGEAALDIALPARGHGIAIAPDQRTAVVLARRPGMFAFAVSLPGGAVTHRFEPGAGRHFCGHGLYARNGTLFLATETDWEGERGLIGVYDVAAGYRRVGEWETGGLDPHDVRLLPDGARIVVANGGILTHPDAPGAKLNLDDMDSSLSVIDAATGDIAHQYRLDPALFQLSIRHLVVGRDGTVAFVMQYEGPSDALVPLGGLLRPSGEMTLLEMPRDGLADLRNYCGSAAVDAAGEIFGKTSPRGGHAAFFRFADGRFLGSVGLSDVCPIAADPAGAGRFYLGGGHGGIERVTPESASVEPLASNLARNALWDNHMAVATPV
jgi:hypothetical protein